MEPISGLLLNEQIGNTHGVVFHIGGADVERPGNVVEGGEEQRIGVLSFQKERMRAIFSGSECPV